MTKGKLKYREYSKDEKNRVFGEFCALLMLIDNVKSMRNFLGELLTPSERFMIARRMQIAKKLLQGSNYEKIREEMGVGYSTISYVDNWINNGFGAIQKEIKKKIKRKKMSEVFESSPDFSFERLRHKYPGHFLLINLVIEKYYDHKYKKDK